MIEIVQRSEQLSNELEQALFDVINRALIRNNRSGDINVAIVDDEEMKRMNRDYRNINSTTDVLSFPALEGFKLAGINDGFLGDIAISLDTAKKQAQEYGHSLNRELAFLAVHGTLHLLGYSHKQAHDSQEMFALQEEILKDSGLIK